MAWGDNTAWPNGENQKGLGNDVSDISRRTNDSKIVSPGLGLQRIQDLLVQETLWQNNEWTWINTSTNQAMHMFLSCMSTQHQTILTMLGGWSSTYTFFVIKFHEPIAKGIFSWSCSISTTGNTLEKTAAYPNIRCYFSGTTSSFICPPSEDVISQLSCELITDKHSFQVTKWMSIHYISTVLCHVTPRIFQGVCINL